MHNVNLYLGGCMTYYYNINKFNLAIDWRIELIQLIDENNKHSPLVHYNYFDPTLYYGEKVNCNDIDKTIVQQNKFYLSKSDILIVNLADLEQSIGTLYEIFYFGIHNKPIIAFGDNELIRTSPHIKDAITIQVKDIKEVMDWLQIYFY